MKFLTLSFLILFINNNNHFTCNIERVIHRNKIRVKPMVKPVFFSAANLTVGKAVVTELYPPCQ